jgi:glycosyltransferase involved in cell wall biosynthesis/serine acetyltransferase
MLNAITYYRLARWLHLHHVPLLPRVIERLAVIVFSCYIPYTAEIGEGFALGHYGLGVVLHEKSKIGRNVCIAQGVTLGGRSQSSEVPRIEDNVYIGPGAKVLGDVVIGSGSVVGANAVVIRSVPPRCIVAGVPARVIRENIEIFDYTGWPPSPAQQPTAAKITHHQSDDEATRVFQMADSLAPGGTETQLVEVACRMNSGRYRITVGCLQAKGPHVDTLRRAGIPIEEFAPRGGLLTPRGILQMLRLASYLRRNQFDVVQTNDLYSNLMGVPAAWLARVPVIISSRRDLASWWWYTPRNRRLLRFTQSLGTFVLANSEAVRDFLVGQDGFNPTVIRVVHNGVDVERFSALPRAKERLFPDLAPDTKLVAVVANMNVKGKGQVDLIEAAREICPANPEVRFLFIGDGVERAGLEQRVKELSLEQNILFLGYRKDVPELLACCDLAVLPSWSEGLPNVVLEYMAAGLPVVATKAGGTVEIVQHGVNGLLVAPKNPAELSRAIMKLLEDPSLAAAMGRNAQAWVREHYSYARVLKELEMLYAEARPHKNRRAASGRGHENAQLQVKPLKEDQVAQPK